MSGPRIDGESDIGPLPATNSQNWWIPWVAFGCCFQGLISSFFFTLWPLPSASRNFLYLFPCMFVYRSIIYMPGAYRGQKKLSDLQEQLLQLVVSHQVCAGNQDFWKNSQCSQPLSQLSSPIFFFLHFLMCIILEECSCLVSSDYCFSLPSCFIYTYFPSFFDQFLVAFSLLSWGNYLL